MKDEIRGEILLMYPDIPISHLEKIIIRTTQRGSGRVGDKSLPINCIARGATIAYIRHAFTSYDALLQAGYTQREARETVNPKITKIILSWMGESSYNKGKF